MLSVGYYKYLSKVVFFIDMVNVVVVIDESWFITSSTDATKIVVIMNFVFNEVLGFFSFLLLIGMILWLDKYVSDGDFLYLYLIFWLIESLTWFEDFYVYSVVVV